MTATCESVLLMADERYQCEIEYRHMGRHYARIRRTDSHEYADLYWPRAWCGEVVLVGSKEERLRVSDDARRLCETIMHGDNAVLVARYPHGEDCACHALRAALDKARADGYAEVAREADGLRARVAEVDWEVIKQRERDIADLRAEVARLRPLIEDRYAAAFDAVYVERDALRARLARVEEAAKALTDQVALFQSYSEDARYYKLYQAANTLRAALAPSDTESKGDDKHER